MLSGFAGAIGARKEDGDVERVVSQKTAEIGDDLFLHQGGQITIRPLPVASKRLMLLFASAFGGLLKVEEVGDRVILDWDAGREMAVDRSALRTAAEAELPFEGPPFGGAPVRTRFLNTTSAQKMGWMSLSLQQMKGNP